MDSRLRRLPPCNVEGGARIAYAKLASLEGGGDIDKDHVPLDYRPIRLATIDDLGILVRHREAMFSEMGTHPDARFEAMLANSRVWFHEHIADGTYLGFLIAALDGSVVAGGGLFMFNWLPTHRETSLRGYILNVYVEKNHRRRGLARQVTIACLGACRERGIGVVSLHASTDGRSVYARLGFRPTSEMRFTFEGL